MYSNAARDDLWTKLSQVGLTCRDTFPLLGPRVSRQSRTSLAAALTL